MVFASEKHTKEPTTLQEFNLRPKKKKLNQLKNKKAENTKRINWVKLRCFLFLFLVFILYDTPYPCLHSSACNVGETKQHFLTQFHIIVWHSAIPKTFEKILLYFIGFYGHNFIILCSIQMELLVMGFGVRGVPRRKVVSCLTSCNHRVKLLFLFPLPTHTSFLSIDAHLIFCILHKSSGSWNRSNDKCINLEIWDS